MTPYEKIRGQKYRKEILPLGEQVLARRLGANVNQLMQPWVTGLWLGRDTLSDEHLIGTAAGVVRSRAVRRLQEPARWVPAALNAMLFTPWSPHLNLPGRDQRTRNQLKPERCLDSLTFVQHQPRIRSQKPRRRRRMTPVSQRREDVKHFKNLIRRCNCRYSHRPVNGDSWPTDAKANTSVIFRRKRGQYPRTPGDHQR